MDGYCRADEHCDNIEYAVCVSNATCQCDYKHKHNEDGTLCHERKLHIVCYPPLYSERKQNQIIKTAWTQIGLSLKAQSHKAKYTVSIQTLRLVVVVLMELLKINFEKG